MLIQCGGLAEVMPIELDQPSTFAAWEQREDWEVSSETSHLIPLRPFAPTPNPRSSYQSFPFYQELTNFIRASLTSSSRLIGHSLRLSSAASISATTATRRTAGYSTEYLHLSRLLALALLLSDTLASR